MARYFNTLSSRPPRIREWLGDPVFCRGVVRELLLITYYITYYKNISLPNVLATRAQDSYIKNSV